MKKKFFDMLGRETELDFPPQRIISLVPSQTELLYDLGLEKEVIGITKFCIHPQSWFRNKERIGGTKQLNLEKIRSLSPDLIIANKEENEKEQIEKLSEEFPVWVSDVNTVSEALEMIRQIGALTGKAEAAEKWAEEINSAFSKLKKSEKPKRVAYFIWKNPWICVGGENFIHDIIETIGWENVLKKEPRYPETTLEALAEKKPELILLSSEPYPFKEKHIPEIQSAFPQAEILLVDGEFFSWYGSRMKKAADYFQEIIGKPKITGR